MLVKVLLAKPSVLRSIPGVLDLENRIAALDAFSKLALPFRVSLSSLDTQLAKDPFNRLVRDAVNSPDIRQRLLLVPIKRAQQFFVSRDDAPMIAALCHGSLFDSPSQRQP